jgi:hypothetical protein
VGPEYILDDFRLGFRDVWFCVIIAPVELNAAAQSAAKG